MSGDAEQERRSLEELLQESKRLREQAQDVEQQMKSLDDVIARKREKTTHEPNA
jgi:hypothetical protein